MIAICFCVVVYVVFTTHSIFTISRQINYVAEHPYKAMSEINKIRARVFEMNTYLPIFISENENNLDGIRSVLSTSCQENEKSLKILDEIYLGNKEDLTELNGALDELKKALIQSVENSENNKLDRPAVQKYFDKEIEPIRVKTDTAIQKVIDSADRRVLIIQESTEEKAEAAILYAAVIGLLMIVIVIYAYKLRNEYLINDELKRQQKILQDALLVAQKANDAKRDFLSRMSHEIRTPINAIVGMSDIAKLRAADSQPVLDCLEKIDTASRHLAALVDDVLDMSKIENDKLQLTPQIVSLHSIIFSTLDILQPLAEKKGVLLQRKVNVADCSVYADSRRLQQIMVNLGANAVKFTAKDKKVVLKCDMLEQDDESMLVRFVLEDEGIGIKESNRQCIFEAFNQGGRSTDAFYGGTGLGLAISQKLAHMMGSEIKLVSTFGVGSRFWFDLRLAKASVLQQTLVTDEIDLHGYRLLVVEDNEINMEIVCELLRNVGAEFATASDGEEAVDLFCEAEPFTYDAVLMDIRMPRMNGYQAAAAIRALPRPDAISVVIIAMTADVLENDVEQSLEQGMDAHVAKPFDTRQFLFLLRGLLQNKENMICK